MSNINPMLAMLAEHPFDSPDHIYEWKWNGVRVLAHRMCDGSVRLQGRSGRDFTAQFPDIVESVKKAVKYESIIDGEVVSLDDKGLPAFNRIQQRIGKSGLTVDVAREKFPAKYMVFDILGALGQDVTSRGPEPANLLTRKKLLNTIVVPDGVTKLSPYTDGKGIEMFEKAAALGQEGIMAKAKSGLYLPGSRGGEWLKMKVSRTGVYYVGGWTEGTGWREDMMGALILGERENGKLRWVGNAGSGFTVAVLQDVLKALQRIKTDECPFRDGTKVAKVKSWVRPIIPVEVKFGDITADGMLIWPIFQRVRTDLMGKEPQ